MDTDNLGLVPYSPATKDQRLGYRLRATRIHMHRFLIPLILIATLTSRADEWLPFNPNQDPFTPDSVIDLRLLNEKQAGDGGFISTRGSKFVHATSGEPVRFWAVNGCPGERPIELKKTARLLAKLGVNLVRIHGGYFDENGNVDRKKVQHTIDIVEALKAEGIYSHLSIYFPIWMTPKPGTPWLPGYNGGQHPFAALTFNREFQEKYHQWWKAVLLTPDNPSGKKLIDDPAIMGAEIVNEDSYFFWTFTTQNVPDAEMRILEGQFGDWLKAKHGSIEAAMKDWKGAKTPRDNAGEGRVGFRGLWEMANQRTPRDQETATFLLESQRGFYEQQVKFLRGLGFKGVITASNWTTADARVLGPLEKYSYTPGDFIDRHGYFGCLNKGDSSEWSIRDGHTFIDRSALRFEPEQPGKPKDFFHTAMDIHYDNKPSMVSETTFNRPNRFRSEAPLYYACYGALQDSDAIVHFAMDSSDWSVKPGYFMQPWTIATPAMAGQFPAAAMIYRKGLIGVGQTVVDLNLKIADLLKLQGTPMPQDAGFDELRLKDVPKGLTIESGNVIDPLVHYVGRTDVRFTEAGAAAKLIDLSKLIDRAGQRVTSTTGELKLDYGKGVLTINSPATQGLSGNLNDAGATELTDLSITSDSALGHIVAISLDGKPLASSSKMLLQVMSEEKSSGFESQDAGGGIRKIIHIGTDPWLIKALHGTVKFKRADAAQLKVTALDAGGMRVKQIGSAAEIKLIPGTLYYLIQ
jgi:hypothetical protein